MRLTLAGRKIPIPFTVSIVILFLLILMTLHQWRIFNKAQRELQDEIAAIDTLKLKQETIKDLTEDINLLTDNIKSLEYMIPSYKDHADLLGYLNSIFMKHNIQIIHLEFYDYVQKDNFNEIPINISLKGQYNEIIDLLKEFRRGDRPLRIDELYMDGGHNNSIIYCDIFAHAFFRETAE